MTGLRAAGERDLSPVRPSATVVLFAVPGPSGVLSSVSLSLVRRPQWLCGRLLCCGRPEDGPGARLLWFRPHPLLHSRGCSDNLPDLNAKTCLLAGKGSLCCLRGAGPLAAVLAARASGSDAGREDRAPRPPSRCSQGPPLTRLGTTLPGSLSVSGGMQSPAAWELRSRMRQVNMDLRVLSG